MRPPALACCLALILSGCSDWGSLTREWRGDAGCPGNLLADPWFEQSAGAWQTYYSTPLTAVAGAGQRGGTALQVCNASTSDRFGLYQDVLHDVTPGDRYRLSASVRSTDGGALSVKAVFDEGGQLYGGGPEDVGATWHDVAGDYTVMSAQSVVPAIVNAVYNPPATACFYVENPCVQKMP